jgi:hypothetical protein
MVAARTVLAGSPVFSGVLRCSPVDRCASAGRNCHACQRGWVAGRARSVECPQRSSVRCEVLTANVLLVANALATVAASAATASFQVGSKELSQFAHRYIVAAQRHTGSKPSESVAEGRVPPPAPTKETVMTTDNRQTVHASTKIGRSLLLAAASAAFVLMPGSLGLAPNAHAEPNNGGEWDIQAYDNCLDDWAVKNGDAVAPGDPIPEGVQRGCCTYSGGVWLPGAHKCGAPAAAATSTRPAPPPGASIIPHPGEDQPVAGL